jgi:hypothetical protein
MVIFEQPAKSVILTKNGEQPIDYSPKSIKYLGCYLLIAFDKPENL